MHKLSWEQLELPDMPPRPQSPIGRLTRSQEIVLAAFLTFEVMTDAELVRNLTGELSPSGARSRRVELTRMGFLERAGRLNGHTVYRKRPRTKERPDDPRASGRTD